MAQCCRYINNQSVQQQLTLCAHVYAVGVNNLYRSVSFRTVIGVGVGAGAYILARFAVSIFFFFFGKPVLMSHFRPCFSTRQRSYFALTQDGVSSCLQFCVGLTVREKSSAGTLCKINMLNCDACGYLCANLLK